MEMLQVLEQKITALVAVINGLKAENAVVAQANGSLLEEKKQLLEKIEQLEMAALAEIKRSEDLGRAQEMTKLAVDDLIKSIDQLVEDQRP